METVGKCPKFGGGLLWQEHWEDEGVGDLHTWSLSCPDTNCDFQGITGQDRDTCIRGGTTTAEDALKQLGPFSLAVNCPTCGGTFRVDGWSPGKAVKCPECDEREKGTS